MQNPQVGLPQDDPSFLKRGCRAYNMSANNRWNVTLRSAVTAPGSRRARSEASVIWQVRSQAGSRSVGCV